MQILAKWTLALLALAITVIVTMAVISCGGGGGGGIAAVSTGHGSVAVAIGDAPLSSLSSFSLTVTGAKLRGTGATSDAVIFPSAGGPQSTTVELLSVQGFSQFLASSQVPAGRYSEIELTFSSVAAFDMQNTAQNITTLSDKLTGHFVPRLTVVAGANQTIELDVDLTSSYFDMGGNNALLTSSLRVNVTSEPVFCHAFPGAVASIDIQADSFMCDLNGNGFHGGASGSVKVQCSDTSTFVSLNPRTVVAGSVTPVSVQLAAGDRVVVKGSLVSGVIFADTVMRVGAGAQAGGYSLHGTILAVDTVGSTLTLKVTRASGPDPRPAKFADITVDASSATVLHRGQTTLGSLVAGNYAHVEADFSSSAWTASLIKEEPAYVAGTAVSVVAGGGVQAGTDLLTFTPVTVNCTPVAMLGAIIPGTLTADVRHNANIQANDDVRLFGFFDGSAHLQTPGPGQPGNGPGPLPRPHPTPNPQPGPQPGPSPSPSNSVSLVGTMAASSSASMTAAGDIGFAMTVTEFGMSSDASMTVTSGATIELLDGNGITVLTAAEAVAQLNAATAPSAIAVWCSTPPAGASVVADVMLRIVAGMDRPMPAPPPPPPGPPPTPVVIAVTGSLVSGGSAVLNASGDIEFDLSVFGGGQPQGTLHITAESSAALNLLGPSGLVSVNANDCLAALNSAAASTTVQLEGTTAASGGNFTADVRVLVLLASQAPPPQPQPSVVCYVGVLASGSTATVGASGDVLFDLDATGQVTGVLHVAVAANATLEVTGTGGPMTVTAAGAAAAINATPSPWAIRVEGSAAASGGIFSADISLLVYASMAPPPPPPGPPPVITLFGHLATGSTATVTAAGDVDFDLDVSGVLGGSVVSITALSTATMKVSATGGVTTVTAAGAAAAINSTTAPYAIKVEGTGAVSSGTFTADVSLLVIAATPAPAPPPPPPQQTTLTGQLALGGSASLNAAGDVVFDLTTAASATLHITALVTATMQIAGSGGVQVISAFQAVAAINAALAPASISVTGTSAASGGTFTADVSVLIVAAGTPPAPPPPPPATLVGTVSGTAVVTAAGDILFTLHVPGPLGIGGTNVAVTVSATANLLLYGSAGVLVPPQTITVAQAVAALNANPSAVTVAGTYSQVSATFAATAELRIRP
jgi:hypothetical protein